MIVAHRIEQDAQSWFRDAERTYTEKHQGCPWCGGSHRVFCQRRGATSIFYCQACDFQVSHDTEADVYRIVPGMNIDDDSVPETMCGMPTTLIS